MAMTVETISANDIAVESMEEVGEKLYLRRGSEYNIVEGEGFNGMNEPVTLFHQRIMDLEGHYFMDTPDRLLNSSMICPQCDTSHRQNVLPHIEQWLVAQGYEFDKDVEFEGHEGMVFDFQLTNVEGDQLVLIKYHDRGSFHNHTKPRKFYYDMRSFCKEFEALYVELDYEDYKDGFLEEYLQKELLGGDEE